MANYTITVNFQDANDTKVSDTLSENEEKKKVENYAINGDISFGESIFNTVKSTGKAFASIFTVASLASTAKQIFAHEIQRIDRYTGSQQAQDVANAYLSMAQMIFKPISSSINLAYELKDSEYANKWESIGLQLYRERGGATLNHSRTAR